MRKTSKNFVDLYLGVNQIDFPCSTKNFKKPFFNKVTEVPILSIFWKVSTKNRIFGEHFLLKNK